MAVRVIDGARDVTLTAVGAAVVAALTALQTAVESRLGLVGQRSMAASTPVVVASDQTAVPMSATSLPLPAGAATQATLSASIYDSLDYLTGPARVKRRYELPTTPSAVQYVGYAPLGTADGAVGWTIKRITLDADSLPILVQWTAASVATWDNRAAEVYS